jgi:membrane fusion protein (multidrug efflux system)
VKRSFHIAFLLLVLIACDAGAVELPAVQPHQGTIYRWISLPASLAPWQQVSLQARVPGYIKSISVDKGDAVKAGQLLAEVEVPDLQADLIKSGAEVKAAEIEVKRLHDARERNAGIVQTQDVEDSEARLSIAQAIQDRSATLLEFAQIKAPFEGTVTARMVDAGAYVSPAGNSLLTIADATTLRCQIPVPETECVRVRAGAPVKIAIEALGGDPITATVSRISLALDPATRTMLAEADVKNESRTLSPGMYANVRIGVEKHENATLIPVGGLVMEKTNAFVFKYAEGKAVKTPVKIGFNDGAQVEIPELKPGERILLPGTAVLANGQDVTIKP